MGIGCACGNYHLYAVWRRRDIAYPERHDGDLCSGDNGIISAEDRIAFRYRESLQVALYCGGVDNAYDIEIAG